MVIHPYKKGKNWVFDDATYNLKAEAFVGGMTQIIDKVLEGKNLNKPENGFTLIFSATPFPEYDLRLDFEQGDEHGIGNWYEAKDLNMIGWLCPALLHYFDKPPQTIYGKAESLK